MLDDHYVRPNLWPENEREMRFDSRLRPLQMLVQKIEHAFAVDLVEAVEKFDVGAVAEAERITGVLPSPTGSKNSLEPRRN